MATVTAATAERVSEIESKSLVDAEIVGNDLVFTTGGAEPTVINAGRVILPAVNSWPVGSIFMNTSSANPASLLGGGTWVRWGQGRMPISLDTTQTEFDVPEETGGAKSVSLTTGNMPAHAHGGATGGQSNDHTHTGYTDTEAAHTHTIAHTHVTPNHTHPGINTGGNTLGWDSNYLAGGSGPGVGPSGASIAVNSGGSGTTSGASNGSSGGAGSHNHTVQTYGTNTGHTHAITSEGSGTAFNNMPPYIVVYMWKRTS